MEEYPARALERALKIQEVILRAISGEILWSQAAEITGLTILGASYDGLFERWLKRLR